MNAVPAVAHTCSRIYRLEHMNTSTAGLSVMLQQSRTGVKRSIGHTNVCFDTVKTIFCAWLIIIFILKSTFQHWEHEQEVKLTGDVDIHECCAPHFRVRDFNISVREESTC